MRFQGILVAVAVFGAASAHSTPVTFTFSGVVTRASDYAADVSSWVGMEFTGSYTVDLDNAQEPWRMLSRSGCALETAGVCAQNYGDAVPVITDWSVQLAGQTWQRIQDYPYFSSTQSVSTSTVKNIYSGQSSAVRTGDPGTLTVEKPVAEHYGLRLSRWSLQRGSFVRARRKPHWYHVVFPGRFWI